MKITAAELAHLLNGTIEGDPNATAHAPAKIEEATAGTIAFFSNPKYESYVYTTEAAILLVEKTFLPTKILKPTLVRVDNVREAVAFLLEKFGVVERRSCSFVIPVSRHATRG